MDGQNHAASALQHAANALQILTAKSIAQGHLLTALGALALQVDPALKGVLFGTLREKVAKLDDDITGRLAIEELENLIGKEPGRRGL